MNDTEDAVTVAAVQRWVARFKEAITTADPDAVVALLHPSGSWRDLLALTWGLHSYYGREQIRGALAITLARTKVIDVRLDEDMPPRLVRRAGTLLREATFLFTTDTGHGRGVVRLSPEDDGQAVTLLTALSELHGVPEVHRGTVDHSNRFGGPNWLDRRVEAARFEKDEPAVLVVGGGQAGVAAAARLTQLGISTLVVDRMERVGDNWRKRYHSLVLHNEVWVNHLPYLPFPDNWPTYVPKDKLANWFEAYVEAMEINFWTGTEFLGGTYDAERRQWRVRIRRNGTERELRPRHVVLATGVSGIPNLPQLPGLDEFAGAALHSSAYSDGESYAGRRVLIVGSGNSGHDIAQDLHAHGASVMMMQRRPTTVVSVGPEAAGRVYAHYGENSSTEDCDLITVSVPYPMLRRSYQLVTAELQEADAELIDGLEKAGFRVDAGEDGTGFQMKYLRRGGGYYLDVGCSTLIATGQVQLLQADRVETFQPGGLLLTDGTVQAFDTVILATGYLPQQELVRLLFGDDVAERVGPVWGFDDEGELRNMWKRTGQDGLWFTAGSLAQCRIYSRYLSLQIRACEDGIIDPAADLTTPRGTLRPEDLVDAALGETAVGAGR